MTDIMSYKGYNARIQYDAADEVFFGKLAGIEDGVAFHGDNVKDLKAAFIEAVDDYLETCAKVGKTPHKPFNGKVMFRIDPDIHRRASLTAELEGVSLNQWAESVLDKAATAR